MAKMRCRCGEVLSDVSQPNKATGQILLGDWFEREFEDGGRVGRQVWECGKCGALWIDDGPKMRCYIPQPDDGKRDILAADPRQGTP